MIKHILYTLPDEIKISLLASFHEGHTVRIKTPQIINLK